MKKFLLYGVLAIVVIGVIGACGKASEQQAKTANTNDAPAEVGNSGRARPPLGGKARPVKDQHNSREAGAEVETYGGFSGALAGTYDTSKDVCGAFSPAKVAKDLGLSSRNPVDVAQAYAETLYQPVHQQAAFEGCLAGF